MDKNDQYRRSRGGLYKNYGEKNYKKGLRIAVSVKFSLMKRTGIFNCFSN